MISVHSGVSCEQCGVLSFSGIRYKCCSCAQYNLCGECMQQVEERGLHPPRHVFLRLREHVESQERPQGRHTESCNECKEVISGFRFFCPCCAVSLCSNCELLVGHNSSHSMLKMPPPPSPPKPQGEVNEQNRALEDYGVSLQQLKDMLRRENELRLGDEVQERYRLGGYDSYVRVTDKVQKQVAREFGLAEADGVELLQCAETLVTSSEDMEDIRNISFYRKYNRMRDGNIKVGDKAPHVQKPLRRLDGSPFLFHEDFLQLTTTDACPCVVIAASHS